MGVKNLTLSAQQIGDCLGVCETAASRKIGQAEALITQAMVLAAARLCRTPRPDRVRAALVERLRTVAVVAATHPDQLEPWIARLMAR